jgi:hypothetical protein
MQGTPTDSESVARAAAFLDVSEFRVFELASARWLADGITPERAEAEFSAYFKRGTVPYWVRDFTRKVIRKFEEGSPDPAEFGVEIPESPAWTRLKGLLTEIFITH